MKNLIKIVKGETPFVTWVKKRIRENLNFICLFSGEPGAGKTYSGISFAEQLDPDFDATKQITFSFHETLKLINSDWFKNLKIKVILWDEPQITISNRAWQSKMNQMMNSLLSTFRHQNIILIFCAPYKDFLDSQSMKLMHCEFICTGWSKKTQLSSIKPILLQYNSSLKIFFPHKLFVMDDGNSAVPLEYWDIKMPSAKNRAIYEPRKAFFTSKLNKQIEKDLDNAQKKENEKENRSPEPNSLGNEENSLNSPISV